jgi:hypothetical protein
VTFAPSLVKILAYSMAMMPAPVITWRAQIQIAPACEVVVAAGCTGSRTRIDSNRGSSGSRSGGSSASGALG